MRAYNTFEMKEKKHTHEHTYICVYLCGACTNTQAYSIWFTSFIHEQATHIHGVSQCKTKETECRIIKYEIIQNTIRAKWMDKRNRFREQMKAGARQPITTILEVDHIWFGNYSWKSLLFLHHHPAVALPNWKWSSVLNMIVIIIFLIIFFSCSMFIFVFWFLNIVKSKSNNLDKIKN